MRSERDDDGRFRRGDSSAGSYLVPAFGNEPLDKVQGFKVSSREEREMEVMMEAHKKLMGWKTKSDMLRDGWHLGKTRILDAIAHPDSELLEMAQQNDVMAQAAKRQLRYDHADQMMDSIQERVNKMEQRRDYGGMRNALSDALKSCKDTKSPHLRAAMLEEFDRRFGRQWESLSKPAPLPGTGRD